MSWGVGSWMEMTSYVAESPGRASVLIALAQSGRAMDEGTLAQMAGILHQQVAGHPVETALLIRDIVQLGEKGLLQRDESGFRWEMTAFGALVSRHWAPASAEPDGFGPLEQDQVRAWRDGLIEILEFDAGLAEQIELGKEELLAAQSNQLAELRVLNRILGEDVFPAWLSTWRDQVQGNGVPGDGVIG